jgi:subtilisin-like proprotein convertase family protein
MSQFIQSLLIFSGIKVPSVKAGFFRICLLSILLFPASIASLPAATSVSNNSSLSIPDNSAPVTSQITFSEIKTITDVNVAVNVTHSYIGDLTLSLISPEGTSLLLHKRSGSSSDNISATYDFAATPYDSLTLFNGEQSQGIWTLSVQDSEAGDTGTLTSWTLTIEGYEGTDFSTVMGTITYEDRPLSASGFGTPVWKPVRYSQVELVRNSDQVVLGSSTTLDDGTYLFAIPKLGTVDCYIRVMGRVISSSIIGQVFNDESSNNIYALVSPSASRNTNTNFELSLGASYDGGSGLGGVFNILDQVVECQSKMALMGELKPPMITVFWKSGTTTGTYFRARDMALFLLGSTSDPDEYDDPVVLHELGHYIAEVYSLDTSLGGDHSTADSNQDLSLAWSEGWATYFSSWIRDYSLYFDSLIGGVTTIDVELPSHASTATGQDNECSVLSVLWDIHDGASSNDSTPGVDDDSFDCSCGDVSLWRVVSDSMDSGFTEDCVIFESFYDGWINKFGDGFMKAELRELLALRSIDFDRYHLYEEFGSHTINGNSLVNVNITVSDDVKISSVIPFIHIEHTNPSDLTVTLYHPDGSWATLHNRSAGSATGRLSAWYGSYETSPVTSLHTAFDGKSSVGQWQLRVVNTGGYVGSVKVFKLDIRGTPATADLVVTSVLAPSAGVGGGTVNVTSTLRNLSSQAVSSIFNESYYLSADRTITATDIFVASFSNGPLAGETSRENTRTITLPSSISSGNYYLGVIVDWDGSSGLVNESIEVNNNGYSLSSFAVSGATAGIDLNPSQIIASSSATSGTTIAVTLTMNNSGTEAAGAFSNSWYLSTDTFINTGDDVFLETFNWTTLAPLSSLAVSRVLTIPASTGAGTWYVGVITDVGNQVDETDEGNNIAVKDSGIFVEAPVAGVDLRAVSLNGPLAVASGGLVSLVSVVKNGGTSSSLEYVDGYYLSSDATITVTDTYINSFTGSVLSSGSEESLSRQIMIPSSTSLGEYYLGLLVEVPDDVDNSNNYASMPLEVISPDLPDLVAVNFIAPLSITPGSVANFTHSISNSGPNNSGPFYIDYYLSTDRTISTSDTFLTRILSSSISGNSGGTFTVSTSVPSSAPVSTWYVGFLADSTFFVPETDESNNAIAATTSTIVTFGKLPDIHISSLNSAASAAGGGPLSVSWNIQNLGEGATSGGFYNRFYLSTDMDFSVDDILLGENLETFSLLPGANFGRSEVFTVPSTITAAIRFLIVTADASSIVIESNETNNFAVSPTIVNIVAEIANVDLRVSNITPPTTAAIGYDFVFNALIRNDGQTGISVTKDFRTDFYISTDNLISAADTMITSVVTRGLAAGGSSYLSLVGTIPATVAAGTWYLGGIVDSLSQIFEDTPNGESNNSGVSLTPFTIRVAPVKADLVPLSVSSPSVLPPGGAFTENFRFANYGNATADLGFWVRVVISSDALFDPLEDITVGLDQYPASVSGTRSVTGALSCVIPLGTAPGVYSVGVFLDAFDDVEEEVEINNFLISENAFVVSPIAPNADLQTINVSSSYWAKLGGSISVERTINNIGARAAGSFVVSIYLSTDSIYDVSDILINTETILSLASGGQSKLVKNITVPGTVPPGTYTVIVRADSGEVIDEDLELNNIGVSSNVVILGGSPDLIISSVSATTPATVGHTMTITRTISNIGEVGVDSGRNIAIRYCLGDDEVVSLDDDVVLHTEGYTGGLASGQSITATTSCIVPGHVSPSDYYIGAYIDVTYAIPESNEGNNFTLSPLSSSVIEGSPDLQSLSLTASSTGVQGTPVNMTLSVKNYQNTTSVPFTANVRLSTNSEYSLDDILLGTMNFDGLGSLQTSQVTSSFIIPPAASGYFYGVAWVDAEGDGVVVETVEGALSNSVSTITSSAYESPDTTAPDVDIEYRLNGVLWSDSSNIPSGTLTIIVRFSEPLSTVPRINIDQEGDGDIVEQPMKAVGVDGSNWFYTYRILPDDGLVNIDGWADMSFSNVFDLQGNSLAAGIADSFKTDSIPPTVIVSLPTQDFPAARITSVNYTLAGTIVDDSDVTALYSVNYTPYSSLTLTNASFFEPMVFAGSPPETMTSDVIAIEARDLAGNQSSPQIIRVILDSDNDGMADWFELRYPFLDETNPADGALDFDGDGLSNADEYRYGTDPTVSDNFITVADAGPDQTGGARLAILDGRGSHTNPPGGALTAKWTYVSGPVAFVNLSPSNSSFTPSFEATVPDIYTFSLEVYDGTRWSAPDYVDIEVENTPPLAHAGFDAVINSGDTFVLDGSRSFDPEGTSLLYTWEEDLYNPQSVSLPTSSPLSQHSITLNNTGVYTYYLDVDDGDGDGSLWAAEVRVIVINGAIRPLLSDSGPLRSVFEGTAAVMDGSVSENGFAVPEGEYWWDFVSSSGGTVSFIGEDTLKPSVYTTQRGSYVLGLTVEDSNLTPSITDEVRVLVHSPTNYLPSANAGSDNLVAVINTVITLDGSETRDVEGNPLTVLWEQIDGPPAVLNNPTALEASFGPVIPGWYRFRLNVTDSGGLWLDSDEVVVSVRSGANQSPVVKAGLSSLSDPDGDLRVLTGSIVSLDANGSIDLDGPMPLSLRWVQTEGPWVFLSSLTAFQPSFIPPVSGRYSFDLIGFDGESEQRDTITFLAQNGFNRPPTAVAKVSASSDPDGDGHISIAPGGTIVLDGSGSSDREGAIVSYQWEQTRGPWVVCNNIETSSPSFSPKISGIYDFSLTVYDGQAPSLVSKVSFQVAIAAPSSSSGGGGGGGCTISSSNSSTSFAGPFMFLFYFAIVLIPAFYKRMGCFQG